MISKAEFKSAYGAARKTIRECKAFSDDGEGFLTAVRVVNKFVATRPINGLAFEVAGQADRTSPPTFVALSTSLLAAKRTGKIADLTIFGSLAKFALERAAARKRGVNG
jgi:hypothetical protein